MQIRKRQIEQVQSYYANKRKNTSSIKTATNEHNTNT